jgi:WD40 repeat protein
MISQRLYLLDTAAYTVTRSRARFHALATSVNFTSDNRWVVSAALDHRLRLWDLASLGEDPIVLHEGGAGGCDDRIFATFYDSKHRVIATFSMDGAIRVWGEKSRSLRRKLVLVNPSTDGEMPSGGAFAEDGRSLGVITLNNRILLFTKLNLGMD